MIRRVKNLLRPVKQRVLLCWRKISTAIKSRLYKEILVLGDSHVMVFESVQFKNTFPQLFFNTICVQGATASGLDNPNSRTQAYPIFRESLEKYKGDTVIMMLGEVDTGFVIWYRAQKYGICVDEALVTAVDTYGELLKSIAKKYNLMCVSTPLPTIRDDDDRGEIANLRKEIRASQRERTELTLKFNELIGNVCEACGGKYVSLDETSMAKNGLVKDELLNSDKLDHHYDKEAHAALIISYIKKYSIIKFE